MSRNRWLGLGIVLGLGLAWAMSGCLASYNHSSPKHLGKTVVKILQRQDAAALKHIVPTEDDLESFLATADMPEDELAAFKEEMKQIIAEFLHATTLAYQKASDAASRAGILLSKTKLGDIRVETWQGPDNELATIEVDLQYREQRYVLKVTEAGKVASGWVVGMKGFELVKQGD